jgi:hypothetical protein
VAAALLLLLLLPLLLLLLLLDAGTNKCLDVYNTETTAGTRVQHSRYHLPSWHICYNILATSTESVTSTMLTSF